MTHSAVISIATTKMEEVLTLTNIDSLMAMNNLSETVGEGDELVIHWNVTTVDNTVDVNDEFKNVVMDISWDNAEGIKQNFTYSEQINLAPLLPEVLDDVDGTSLVSSSNIITSALNTNEVIYFEPNMNYQEGAFVIYDSYLYKATEPYVVGNDYPHLIKDPDSGVINDGHGWQSYGPIDNPKLADENNLSTQFFE